MVKKIKQKPTEKKETLNDNNSYTAKDIYVLEGLDPVRKRPGMYIGSTGVDGLHHLIWEVVDNSIDEAMAGFAKNILIEILAENEVAITDDGRGIPVDVHKKTKKSALEIVLTTLHAGGKFGGKSYKVAGGLHGVGVSVVNALSEHLQAEICREGILYQQEYSRGKAITKLKKAGKSKQEGTKIVFKPDPEIFKDIKFDTKKILDHLRQQAYLTPGTTIRFKDYREGTKLSSYTFHFESGIIALIRYLARDYKRLTRNVFYISQEKENILVEVALAYIDDNESTEASFANNIYTPEGGMHLTGFRSALTRSLNDYAKEQEIFKNGNGSFTGEDTREGLIAVISVKLQEPQFEGQTKAKLGNPEVRTAVEQVVGESFKEFLEINKEDAKRIIEKSLLSAKAREAAKKARENILRKGILEGMTLPGKLADCISRRAEESELFIVEGDSAGGSAKTGRDRNTQAILPLRGKILNIEKSRFDRMMSSEEIRALIVALGTAISEDFNLNKLRYHKVVIMTDADSDGAHIRTLLLTLFFRYFRPIIDHGYLYIAQPPLYRIQKGKEIHYAYNEAEKQEVLDKIQGKAKEKEVSKSKVRKLKIVSESKEESILAVEEPIPESKTDELAELKGISIQRYKGLGEMNPDQLWETTMDPAQRVLKLVTIENAENADRLFDILMGKEVLPRKKFIQAYAQKVQNLDV
ncbi:MAG: DNA topoisomerase (ATP-hydrolyzing) subunit B [Candidatus Pacebacteria bacterium]|nr:DNA topoisomerase (ATP-hydrolyzing) subunit B [Candidatus Paceibacterota bacterium]MDD5721994.1 DNA topoisomerase (ATP-hydrolyzing) subunit B [Candidatus Paceibacterota bacterium]